MEAPTRFPTTPSQSSTSGTSDAHTPPSTPGAADLKKALHLTGKALRLATRSVAPDPNAAVTAPSGETFLGPSDANFLLDQKPSSSVQEPGAASKKAAPRTNLAVFLARFETLAFDKLSHADPISQTLPHLDHLAKRVKAFQSACSHARTYPNPDSFSAKDLLAEAASLQSTATRLAGTAEPCIPVLCAWVQDIAALTRDGARNATRHGGTHALAVQGPRRAQAVAGG
ncbi:hypothetical protein PMIN01_11373 [Paraphaeosphaeria minitans]|uniref:Uncharacterized protein n=1 Tax=Paraphaeosphaeria minitans TaxID=565426 RepID=A0A9P6GA68_9PLEO|nr:hypothetical protein PMIN01_11373 [Paraphaeosphaeria minitans]